MSTYLDKILLRHREVAAGDQRSIERLLDDARAMPDTRGFRAALAGRTDLGVISEVKRRSPSKGDLNLSLDPVALVRAYEAGGASCVSVLTDEEFFGGSVADLQDARAACSLPVLRKDFTVTERDVLDARLMGADCVLLIAAGLDVLVEIHDERELEVALAASAMLIGVNQRDLVTFQVDHERAVRMGGTIPSDVVRVAESGVRGAADAASLHAAGYHAVLVGETLVTSGDPAAAVRELVHHSR
jgi:indole-3-glycerol phosphate synthase